MLRKTLSAVVSACVLCGGICANASDLFSSVVSYVPETGELTASGVAQKGNVVVMVVPESTDLNDLGENLLPTLIRPFSVDGGAYEVTVGIPSDTPGGKYSVYVSQNGEEITDTFVYMNIAAAERVIPQLNSANGNEFKNLLKDNAINLGIDTDDAGYIEKSDSIIRLLDNMTFDDIYDFYNKYITAYAICMIEGADDTDEADAIIRKYAVNLGIDYDADFASDDRLSEDSKKELLVILTQTDFSKKADSDGNIDFGMIAEEMKPVAAVRCVTDWIGLKSIITEDFSEEFEDMISSSSKYQKIKDKDLVYAEMMKKDFDSMEDVEDAFDSAVTKIYNNENKSSSGGGGSKSSGGGLSTVITPPADQLESEENGNNDKAEFSDIDISHWAYVAVASLADDSVISGYEDGTFRPSASITRAEFTKMILKFAADIPSGEAVEFDDVSVSDWYFDAVTEAASKGLVSGTGTGFNPNAYIKREDAALIIYRLLNLLEKPPRGYRPFADRKDVSDYAEDAVFTLGGAYIINGDEDNMFHPQNNITRAEAAQLLYNALKK